MEFSEYQELAARTHVKPASDIDELVIALLGIAGEAGSLLTEFKKNYREGSRYILFKDRLREELGDILWYLSDIARQSGLRLDEIAKHNLKKTQELWVAEGQDGQLLLPGIRSRFFDDEYRPFEQLPRRAAFEFIEYGNMSPPKVRVIMDSCSAFGQELTDNSPDPDGYRFHDAFHLAYATILHWSPAVRKSLNRKRKTSEEVDEIEDGGRALVVEEAVSALVFEYAREHSLLEGADGVDYELLRTIKALTQPYEVRRCTMAEWQIAILAGFEVWRPLKENRAGKVTCNAYDRTLFYEPIAASKDRAQTDGRASAVTVAGSTKIRRRKK